MMRFPQIVQDFHIEYTPCKDNKLFRKHFFDEHLGHTFPPNFDRINDYCCPCEAGQKITFFKSL